MHIQSRKWGQGVIVCLVAAVLILLAVCGCATERGIRGIGQGELVRFAPPWSSVFNVDALYPFQLVNDEGEHLFILNKTAWHYFGCENPEGVLDRAAEQGVNVLRVCLEGRFYYETLGLDEWPWRGTRAEPDWSGFDEHYWDEVERRIRMAGERGIGLDLVLYGSLKPKAEDMESQKRYWSYTLKRLSKYSNILTWEIANEYLGNEEFQGAAGRFLKANDPYGRPVCTSDGTTDDAAWADKDWVDLAINHTCTSSTEQHDLEDWYLALARNTRGHGKPAFCNESGREKRHRNDDPVHRRKQGWLWSSAGCFWTWHSWDGCEGIDEVGYQGPGWEYCGPMAEFFRAIPFWKLSPNYTAVSVSRADVVSAVLADPERSLVVGYVCSRVTGSVVSGLSASLRLPDGSYEISFVNPEDLSVVERRSCRSDGLKRTLVEIVPDFPDDIVIKVERVSEAERTVIPGTL